MKKERFHSSKKTMHLLFQIAPRSIYFFILTLSVISIISAARTFFNQRLYDDISKVFADKSNEQYAIIAFDILIVVCIVLILRILFASLGIIKSKVIDKCEETIEYLINDTISKIPAETFESKNMLDEIEKGKSGAYATIDFLISLIDLVFSCLLYLVLIGIYLWQVSKVLVIALLLVFLPVAISQFFQAKVYSNQEDDLSPLFRMEDSFYYHAMDVRETRLFGVFWFFQKMRLRVMRDIFKIQWRTQGRINRINFLLNVIKIIGWISITVLLFYLLSIGRVSIGAFTAIFTSVGTMFGYMEQTFSTFKGGITNNIGKIKNFQYLFSYSDKYDSLNGYLPDFSKEIIIDNISFYYPDSKTPAISNVSFKIKKGEVIALVGENGSGKTTPSKLICGLYIPTNGDVILGGCNTKETRQNELFKKTTAVFQNYKNYTIFTLRDNIRISDFDNDCDVLSAIKSAEINIDDSETFPEGLDTIMSREFGGVDISKGQWQRVAISRGIYKKHDLIIFDEPTAAIDPLEEARLYNHFADYSKGSTTIFVTHRLASTKIADRIIVMDHGKIIESGSHTDLIKLDGFYAKMWKAQAVGYADN